jgi:hypothetical protein
VKERNAGRVARVFYFKRKEQRGPCARVLLFMDQSSCCRKIFGELAEAIFMDRAIRLGYIVSKPYGDSAPYDFVVGGISRRLKRVQVRATFKLDLQDRYSINAQAHGRTLRHDARPYTPNDIDFLAAYVAPLDLWYILPVNAVSHRTKLFFYPHAPVRDCQWRKYREAWWRLGRRLPNRPTLPYVTQPPAVDAAWATPLSIPPQLLQPCVSQQPVTG